MNTQLLCLFTTKGELNKSVEFVLNQGGILDNSYMIDWDEFKNCIITTSSIGYKKIPTKVFKSFNTDEL